MFSLSTEEQPEAVDLAADIVSAYLSHNKVVELPCSHKRRPLPLSGAPAMNQLERLAERYVALRLAALHARDPLHRQAERAALIAEMDRLFGPDKRDAAILTILLPQRGRACAAR